jgi:hypothetical protein
VSAGFSRVAQRYLHDVSPRDLDRAAAILAANKARIVLKLEQDHIHLPERLRDLAGSSERSGVAITRIARALDGHLSNRPEMVSPVPLHERRPLKEDVVAAALRLRGVDAVAAQSMAGTVLDALLHAGFTLGWEAPNAA